MTSMEFLIAGYKNKVPRGMIKIVDARGKRAGRTTGRMFAITMSERRVYAYFLHLSFFFFFKGKGQCHPWARDRGLLRVFWVQVLKAARNNLLGSTSKCANFAICIFQLH